jgi:hypothetical protein
MSVMKETRVRLLLPAVALVAAAAIAAGCGDDDDGGSSDEAQTLTIEATGGKDGVSFEAPAEAEAGVTEIEFTNNTTEDELDGQLVYVAEERSDEQVLAQLGNATEGRPVEAWFQGGGGAGTTAKGETTTVTQVLKPGTYYAAGSQEPQPPLTKIEVTGEEGEELPEADGTVTAGEYLFESEGLPSGESTIELENGGGQWHHFLASPLKEGATIEDAKRFFRTEKGQPPFEGAPGDAVSSSVLEGGTSQLVDLELEPGRYAFLCFISDKQGGPPHVVKGMISEVTVE